MLMIGKKAPEFKATALVGKDFKDISLSDYKGKYVVLFSTHSTSPLFARQKS
jgi:peroxiredoxin (alkyl hydroperoxide reductase subunit C)